MPVCEGWCGQCYSNIKGRSNYRGHQGYRSRPTPAAEGVLVAIKKRQSALEPSAAPVALAKTLFAKSCPTLFEFLSAESYEDGTSRQLPTITVFVSPSGFQACLNDRDQSQACFVTSGTLEGLWAALEKGLADDTLAWRPSASRFQKRTRK